MKLEDIYEVKARIFNGDVTEEEEKLGRLDGGTFRYEVVHRNGEYADIERYQAPKGSIGWCAISFMSLPIEVQEFIKTAIIVSSEIVYISPKGQMIKEMIYMQKSDLDLLRSQRVRKRD